MSLYDRENGAGNLLSQGSITSAIVAGNANSISLVFNGVPASVAMSIDNQPAVNTPSTVHLTVNVKDADGNVIIGPGTYPTVQLSNDDTTGTVTLASTTATPPNAVVAASYNGNWISSGNASANITGTIQGSSATGTFAISPQPIETTLPGAFSQITYGDSMTAGPDGALWFVGNPGMIYRITTGGVISTYSVPQTAIPNAITTGPDGALWFTDDDTSDTDVGRITTSGSASVCTGVSPGLAITTGPDGSLWMASYFPAQIDRITTSCAVTAFPEAGGADALTSGPDGAIWYVQQGSENGAIGRITTSGSVTTYTLANAPTPEGITSYTDGALWFTEEFTGDVARISTTGSITWYKHPQGVQAYGSILTGPDGALWFETFGGVGRISKTGQYTTYSLSATPTAMTLGSDNALWGIDFNNGNIVHVAI